MKRFLSYVTLVAFLGVFTHSPQANAKTDVEFILDASGSMRASMEGKTQMDVAKSSIKAALESVPADTHVALRVYAHRVSQENKTESCVDSELMIPFGPLDKAAFSAKVDSLQPKGYTPIAYSLQQTEKDFGVEREAEKVIILVSDGEETCGGNPVQVVKDLIAKGFKLKVNAVGFKVDATAQAQLKAIADAGGGKYYDAQDASSLASSLKDITQKALLVEKPTSVYGTEVQGGNSYETAVPLLPNQLNQELRLNHHQRRSEYDYFALDLKAGQSLKVTVKTGAKGVDVQGGLVRENESPYTGFQIHNSERTKVGGGEIIGGANATKSDEISILKSGRYYVMIGSVYEAVHKDQVFKVEVQDFFDASSGADAGSNFDTALAIQRQNYPLNYLARGDEGDMYVFPTVRGETLVIKIVPESTHASLRASLYDDLRVEIASGFAPNAGAGFRISAIATGSKTYLKVHSPYSDAETKYSVEFEGLSQITPPPPTALSTTLPMTLPSTLSSNAPATTQPVVAPPPIVSAPPTFPETPATTTPPPTSSIETSKPVTEPAKEPRDRKLTNKAAPKNTQEPATNPQSLDWTTVQWTDRDTVKFLGIIFGIGAGIGLVLGIVIRGMFVRKPKKEAA